MFNPDFVDFLRVTVYISIVLFMVVGTVISIYLAVVIAKIARKVNDSLTTVQGAAFSLYEKFDTRTSILTSGVVDVLGSLLSIVRRRK